MGKITLLSSLTLFTCVGGTAFAGEQGSLVDIPVTKVYLPTRGYDDNDAIEVVVEGELPNPCYTLGKTIVGPVINNTFMVRQLAWRNIEGACGTGDLIEDPVPFTSVGSIGQLPMGEYRVQFTNDNGSNLKAFNVQRAEAKYIDNFGYAAIQTVDAQEIYYEGDEVFVTLNGIWTSKCQILKKPIEVDRDGDLFIVLPILAHQDPLCEKTSAPFAEKVSLGRLTSGTYLVHSRSRGGKAIYRPFQVWPRVK